VPTTDSSRAPTAHDCAAVAKDPSDTLLVRKRVAVATAFVTRGFSFDDESTVNSRDELKRAVASDK
jgi:hypothetical protein